MALSAIIFLNIACSEEPPSVRVKNERTTKVNVQVKQYNDNTININNVEGGTVSGYQDIAEGTFTANAVIQNETESPSITFRAANDNNYTVVVVNATPPTLRIDTESK
ncbi:MAG: hypothetical protein V1720_07995 [bacterium]